MRVKLFSHSDSVLGCSVATQRTEKGHAVRQAIEWIEDISVVLTLFLGENVQNHSKVWGLLSISALKSVRMQNYSDLLCNHCECTIPWSV